MLDLLGDHLMGAGRLLLGSLRAALLQPRVPSPVSLTSLHALTAPLTCSSVSSSLVRCLVSDE